MWTLLVDYWLRNLVRKRVDKVLGEFQDVKQEIIKLKTNLSQVQREIYDRYAGDRLESMLESRESTERFMFDDDPRIRFIAIDLLLAYWGLSEADIRQCIVLAMEDPDIEVRQAALLSIGKYYANSYDVSIRSLLDKITGDESTCPELRKIACQQLRRVIGEDTWWLSGEE